jgi:hypothetical protein
MRYRALDADGDYQFGPGTPWLVNSPPTVAQAIRTRLGLLRKTWFLDDRVGFDTELVLGNNTQTTRDQEVQRIINETPGVREITVYSSNVDPSTRAFTVEAVVDTIYGSITISETL